MLPHQRRATPSHGFNLHRTYSEVIGSQRHLVASSHTTVDRSPQGYRLSAARTPRREHQTRGPIGILAAIAHTAQSPLARL